MRKTRYGLVGLVAMMLAGCAGSGPTSPAPAVEAPAPAPAAAVAMKITLYDDGLACPGGCDAHVVFHPSHNGTLNAFAPPRAAPTALQKCQPGGRCMICFDADIANCMVATYRGSGPTRGRFDMTPALFEQGCGRPGLPAAFAAECARLSDAALRLGYERRINCVAEPGLPLCSMMIAPRKAAQEQDATEREKCLRLGQSAYNAQQADERLHRTHGCNYFLNQKGRNSAGETWFKLTPGACRPETYVGRDGLDCCSASVFAAAAFHPECRGFFVDRP